MKFKLKIVIFLLFASVLSYLGYQIISIVFNYNSTNEQLEAIPNFEFEDLRGNLFTNNNLKEKSPLLFVYFNSENQFCNEETILIKEKIKKFKTLQILFVSIEKPIVIYKFAHKHNLLNYENVVFLSDTNSIFLSTFNITHSPCIILYDSNNNLIHKFYVESKVENLFINLN